MPSREFFSNLLTRLLPRVMVFGLLMAGGVATGSAQDFYKGKTLTVVVGSNPGGGTDTTARLLTRYWASHIPGKPDILVRNKGISLIAANELHHQTRPDGLTVAALTGAEGLGPVARNSTAVKYDPLQWGIVGSIERGSTILLVRKDALSRLTDPKAKPVVIGSVAADRPQDAMAVFGAEYLNWNIKFVLGYPGSNDVYLAFERGEVDMFGSGTNNILKRFISSGEAVAIAAENARRDFAAVPTFETYLGDKKPRNDQWRVFRAWAGPSQVDKFYALPPNTPAAILDILRASFIATSKDPEFQAQAETMLGEGVTFISGQQTYDLIEDVIKTSPELQAFTQGLRKKYGLPLVTELK